MKYAIEFCLEVLENGEKEWSSVILAGEREYISQEYDFEYDIWDWLKEEPDLEKLKTGVYHIFICGTVSEEWSDNWEYGREYDGLVFEADSISVRLCQP